ncbi:MAG: hypothetical protein EKK54_05550 [Neisseriaceae bacterium]|nr:MAG: hypothetical protein EKK54_05550 [Neisseriaceae bacterium]
MKYNEYQKLKESKKIREFLNIKILTEESLVGLVPIELSKKICNSRLNDDCRKGIVYVALIIEQIGIDPNLLVKVVNPFLFVGSDSIVSLSMYLRGNEEEKQKIVGLLNKFDFSYGEYIGDMFTLILTMAKDSISERILADIIEFARDPNVSYGNKIFAYETIWKEYIRLSNMSNHNMQLRVKEILNKDMVQKAVDYYYLISSICKPGTIDKIQNILQH